MERRSDIRNIIIARLFLTIILESAIGARYIETLKDTVKEPEDIIYHAETTGEIDELRTMGKPVIVVFGADYCPTCINYKPYVKEIANLFGDEVIVKYIDTVEHEPIRKEYNIELIPSTLLFDKDGNVYEPSTDLNVTKSDEIIDERRYISDEFRIAEEGEILLNDQFEYGMNKANDLSYCKFVGLLDMIQLEEIILELIK